MRTKPESTEANLHLGRGCGLSPNPPEQTRILGADAADPGVVSCARSVTHRRMRSLPCSSPPSARHAPHPKLLRSSGGPGLRARLGRALGHASTDALPHVLVASFGSARPASRSAAPEPLNPGYSSTLSPWPSC